MSKTGTQHSCGLTAWQIDKTSTQVVNTFESISTYWFYGAVAPKLLEIYSEQWAIGEYKVLPSIGADALLTQVPTLD